MNFLWNFWIGLGTRKDWLDGGHLNPDSRIPRFSPLVYVADRADACYFLRRPIGPTITLRWHDNHLCLRQGGYVIACVLQFFSLCVCLSLCLSGQLFNWFSWHPTVRLGPKGQSGELWGQSEKSDGSLFYPHPPPPFSFPLQSPVLF